MRYVRCLDLSRCYYPHWGRLGWAVCLRFLVALFKGYPKPEPQKSVENSSETCRFVEWIKSFKKCSLGRLIKTQACLLGLLVVLLLLWGCSTLQSSRYSAPSTLESLSSPSLPPKTKNPPKSSGDSLLSRVGQILPPVLRRDTSLLLQSPLWGQSLDSTSHQEDEKDKNARRIQKIFK